LGRRRTLSDEIRFKRHGQRLCLWLIPTGLIAAISIWLLEDTPDEKLMGLVAGVGLAITCIFSALKIRSLIHDLESQSTKNAWSVEIDKRSNLAP
jgi:hypothetical protein